MLKLEIPNDIYAQMVAQARAEAPIEACGILAGTDGKAEKLYKMTNADAADDHFMMAPAEQFAVAKDVRSEGFEILAIYHSHPESPARPSAEDIRMALTQGVTYVIVSLLDNDTTAKGFLRENDEGREVPVVVSGTETS